MVAQPSLPIVGGLVGLCFSIWIIRFTLQRLVAAPEMPALTLVILFGAALGAPVILANMGSAVSGSIKDLVKLRTIQDSVRSDLQTSERVLRETKRIARDMRRLHQRQEKVARLLVEIAFDELLRRAPTPGVEEIPGPGMTLDQLVHRRFRIFNKLLSQAYPDQGERTKYADQLIRRGGGWMVREPTPGAPPPMLPDACLTP